MDGLFLAVINMSLIACYVIVFVIAVRLLLKKLPKVYSYALWFPVLFRLICPFSFDGIFSLIPKDVNIPQDIAYSPRPEINSGITAIDSAVNNLLPAPPLNNMASVNPMQIWLAIAEAVWVVGIAILLIYSVITSIKMYRKIMNANHIEDNIYNIDGFKTPFVFGIVNPKIYLPAHLSESEKSYVLLHEQTHIKRLDHIVKLIFFIVTCIHWFNPLVWIAFYLMGEDMELSCDENVVKQMGSNIKKEYSSSLLSMSTGRKILGGSPIAFGENNTKGRIKNVLNYKKPALWVLIVASIIIVLFVVGLITNPKSNEVIISDRRPMIMVNEELYLDTGKVVIYPYSTILGKITSSVDQSEKPTEDGQSNFGNIGALYAYFEDGIVVFMDNGAVFFERENIPQEVSVYLNKINESAGMYEEVTVETKDNEKTFPWRNVTNPSYAPVTYVADVDGDSNNEIIILLTTDYGTGVYIQDIHVLNLDDLSELEIENPIEVINKTVSSYIGVFGEKDTVTIDQDGKTIEGEKVVVKIEWDGETIEKQYDKSYAAIWFENVAFGSIINYEIENDRIIVKVPGAVSPTVFPVTAILKYDKDLKIMDIDIIENASYVETGKNNYTNYDKINSYLKERSINTFSLYYELLDFIISDYQEELVNGNVEAVFSYTIVHKNYDKDPDTVQYIKEAKERGDKNYQTYYDEYLQPQDMNFYFKALIDENDTITLYTKNPAIENDDWHQVEMSNYIIGKITEEHESENINRNEPIENDIAEYISYDYEYRFIYIAGLEIFEEFGTEEFGYSNEGSARIINDENALEFFITVNTGLVPGAGTVTGPEVYFKIALDTNKVVEKRLIPAPNYAEIAKLSPEHINPDSIQYSEKIIELSDERIVEIAVYLKEFILKTESKFDYFTYED